ncbi:phage tail tape measure protein [Kitasatospora sp. MBT63]|uniref:phage tail tape measure protein n=1 Tax=Kitasatospora sp. MBT63 TaxID=1444768 RepID=UPI00053B6B11|nr:phage tail tape measure protein [Kitasatospora sp. MBT63]
MASAYTLYVQLQAGLSGLTTGLRGGAQQLRAFDGQLSNTRAELQRVEAAAERLGQAQVAAAAAVVRSQAEVQAAVERSAAAQTTATAAAERAGRAQAVAASAAARAQTEQTAAVEATTRATRAQEIAQTMAARAQATAGAGAAAAQRTAEAAAASATRAAEAQTAQATRAAAAQETAARAALLAERTSASAAAAAVAASQARAGQVAAEEQAAQRTVAATAAVTRAQNEAAAAAQAATAARISGFVKGGLVLAAILAAGVAGSISLEKEMANVLTISRQIDGRNVGAFTDQIIRLSTELPQSSKQLAEGLYQIVSTGFDGAEAMTILRVAAQGASAGLTTTEVSARALLGVLKAYGLPASAAADVMDIMFQTVNKGVVSFSELAQQLGDVVPMAAAAGVSFADLSSALAAITLAGIPAAESATALNMLMTRMMKPTKDLGDLMKSLGYESAASAVQQDGLYVVMGKINAVTHGQAEATANLFKDIRATRAALALAAADGKNYADTYQAINFQIERAGATQRAYAIQMDTTSGQWDLFKNKASALGMNLAGVLLPVLQELAQYAGIVAGAIGDLPGPVKEAAGILIALSAAAMIGRAGLAQITSQLAAFRAAAAEAAAGGSVLPAVLRGTSLAVSGLTGLLAIGVLGYAAYSASKQQAKAATDDLVAALRREKEEHDAGAGLRALTESLANSDDMKKLKSVGLELNEVIDGLVSGGDKLAALNEKLDIGKAKSWDPNLGAYDTNFDQAKKILQDRSKSWSDAVKAAAEYADAMNIVKAKVDSAVQGAGGPWSLEKLLPTDKDGAPKYSESMKALGKAIGDIVQPTEAWKAAQDRAASSSRTAGLQIDLTKTSISGYIDKLSEQSKASRSFQQDLDELTTRGYGPLAEHFRSLGDASAGMAHDLVANLKAGKKGAAEQLSGLVDATRAGLDDYLAELRRQLQAQRDFQNNLSELAIAGYGDLTNHFAELGVSAAPMLDELVRQLKDGKTKVADELQSIVAEDAARSQNTFQAGLEQLPGIAAKYGEATARAWATAAQTNDVAAFGKILQQMAVTDMTKAVQAGTDASRSQMATGLDLVTQVAQAKGVDAAQGFAHSLLAGDIEGAMTTLQTIWGSKQPISAPDLSAVVGAFKVAGTSANDQWSAMLNLIAQVSKEKGAAAAQALTEALLSGDMGKVQAALDSIGASVRAIPGSKTINVNVNKPDDINIPVHFSYDGYNSDGSPHIAGMGHWADGGLVSFYANGALRPPRDEQHIAQIAPAGSWRVWAEPETGGEAYVPLAASKRTRSKAILDEVAHRFGGQVIYGPDKGRLAARSFADGGVTRPVADLRTARRGVPAAGMVKLVAAHPAGPAVVVVRDTGRSPLVGSMPVTVTGADARPEAFADAVMRRLRAVQRGGQL